MLVINLVTLLDAFSNITVSPLDFNAHVIIISATARHFQDYKVANLQLDDYSSPVSHTSIVSCFTPISTLRLLPFIV